METELSLRKRIIITILSLMGIGACGSFYWASISFIINEFDPSRMKDLFAVGLMFFAGIVLVPMGLIILVVILLSGVGLIKVAR